MLKQNIKDLYFAANRWLVVPNTLLARVRFARSKNLALHLGCGDDYRPMMLNIDGNIARRKDLWLDLRNRLPFETGSVRLIYCSHVLEHLFPEQAISLLREMRRILSEDGIARIAVPSFEKCLNIVQGIDQSEWPRRFPDPLSQAINYIFCDGQHKYAYCFGNFEQFARESGFRTIVNYSITYGVSPKDYHGIQLGDEPPGSLVVELSR